MHSNGSAKRRLSAQSGFRGESYSDSGDLEQKVRHRGGLNGLGKARGHSAEGGCKAMPRGSAFNAL